MWGSIIAPLSGTYRCYCIDTITDANKSVATKRVREVADYVAWLREVFAALGIENAHVAGLSYGGWLAALLGVHAPELVNRLVLLCAHSRRAHAPSPGSRSCADGRRSRGGSRRDDGSSDLNPLVTCCAT
jgi:pimeloyl-ACP methyl ester carboxylesterase